MAAQAIIRTVLVSRGYFWQDDYLHLSQARRYGLSGHFLFQDYNDHLEPGKFVLVWITAQGTGLHYAVAATTMVALQTLASLALLWVLRELFGKSTLLLVPFSLYLFTPLLLVAGTWWSASLEALPLQIAMLASIASAVRYFHSRHRLWQIASWSSFAAGLCFWEKAVLIFRALLGVVLLILVRDVKVRDRIGHLSKFKGFWFGHVFILAGYLAIYFNIVHASKQSGDNVRVGTVFNRLILQTLIPGIFGGPWTGNGVKNTIAATPNLLTIVVTSATLVGLILTSVMLRGRAAASPWCFLGGYIALDVLLLAVGRTDFSDFLARDPRYITDALPIVIVCIAAAFAPGDEPAKADAPSQVERYSATTLREGSLPARIEAGASPSSGATVIVAVVFSALVTTSQVSFALRHDYSRRYTENALSAARHDSTLQLVDVPAPAVDVVAQSVSTIFEAAGVHVAFGQPSTHLEILDGFGVPRLVTFLAPTLSARGPKKDCGWVTGTRPRKIVTIAPDEPSDAVLRLGYLSGAAATIRVAIGGKALSVVAPKGLGVAYFPIKGLSGPIEVNVGPTDPNICVSDVTVGQPWPSQ